MKTYHVGGCHPTNRYRNLGAALAVAEDDDTIELHKDCFFSGVIQKNLIIKGNGHTIEVENNKVGLLCEEPVVLEDLRLSVAPRSNGILLKKGGTLHQVVTQTLGPARVLYPTVLVKEGTVQIQNSQIMKLVTEASVTAHLSSVTLTDYYGGFALIESAANMSLLCGKTEATSCTFVSTSFQGTAHLTRCRLGAFNENKGALTLTECLLAPLDVPCAVKESKEPIDGPLSKANRESKFTLEQESGSLVVEAYISDIPKSFVGFHIRSGSVHIKRTNNRDTNGYHLIHRGSISFTDVNDAAFYEIQEASMQSVRSRIRSTKRVKTAMERLQELTGLAAVKKSVQSIVNTVARNKQNPNPNFDFSWHMIFAGDPGTGKTTVAKIVAQALFEIGAIPENKCTEVSVDRLVKGYVGQTAEHVRNILDDALGGVLFIDEAYELAVREGQNSFNSEVLSVLIRYMEEHRDNLVVIAAGYEKEMKQFLASNVGLTRRFQWISFADYTETELTEIFESIRRSYRESYAAPELANRIPALFHTLVTTYRSKPDAYGRITSGGNGGLARNLFQRILMARNDRIAANPGTEERITEADIRMGFSEEWEKAKR